jgi:hypothetical protein
VVIFFSKLFGDQYRIKNGVLIALGRLAQREPKNQFIASSTHMLSGVLPSIPLFDNRPPQAYKVIGYSICRR